MTLNSPEGKSTDYSYVGEISEGLSNYIDTIEGWTPEEMESWQVLVSAAGQAPQPEIRNEALGHLQTILYWKGFTVDFRVRDTTPTEVEVL
jgi:hypothetical protein